MLVCRGSFTKKGDSASVAKIERPGQAPARHTQNGMRASASAVRPLLRFSMFSGWGLRDYVHSDLAAPLRARLLPYELVRRRFSENSIGSLTQLQQPVPRARC